MSQTIKERARTIVAREFGIDEEEVQDDAQFLELGADSFDMIQLVMALEDEFGLEISEEDADQLTTLTNLVAYVETPPKKP